MRIREALALARTRGVARLDAQLLLAHRLQRPRTWLLTHEDVELSAADATGWLDDLQQRADEVPLAYLTGQREFHGLILDVTPAVLVPRPETELLVDWALERLAGTTHTPAERSVIDLGTGSGAIALALKHRRPDLHCTAVDASAAALEVAHGNARRLALDVEFVQGSWWHAVAGRRFGLAVSNPPYVAPDDPHLEALRHEPRTALTPGGDGLSALREIVDGAPSHLHPGAWLLLEHGHDQADAVRAMLHDAGFTACETRHDLAGHPRCSGGLWGG